MRDYTILSTRKSEKIAQNAAVAGGGIIWAMPERKGVFIGDVFTQKRHVLE